MGFLALLAPLFSGLMQPIKDYLNYKNQELSANRDLKLAQINADKEAIIAQTQSDTTQRANYLGATSTSFRQGTFYWMSAIILYSIVCPDQAEVLWHNFRIIPHWVVYIYVAMLSVTWGLPVAKENIGLMFSSIGRGLAASREFKLAKAQINHKVVIDALKKAWFPKGMNQAEVNLVDTTLDAAISQSPSENQEQ